MFLHIQDHTVHPILEVNLEVAGMVAMDLCKGARCVEGECMAEEELVDQNNYCRFEYLMFHLVFGMCQLEVCRRPLNNMWILNSKMTDYKHRPAGHLYNPMDTDLRLEELGAEEEQKEWN